MVTDPTIDSRYPIKPIWVHTPHCVSQSEITLYPFPLTFTCGTKRGDYTEGNAWQYVWHVQHDVDSLIEMMGGNKAFTAKLDSLFWLENNTVNTGFVSDVTGLIGQYAHGNEPSHHVAVTS